MSEPGQTGSNGKYSSALLDAARQLYLRGATHREVAPLYGASFQTVRGWVQKVPEFREMYLEARSAAGAYRLSQIPPLEPLYPADATAGTSRIEEGHPIIKVERIFVKSPVRDR